ncbi:MAG: class B sortase [Ruminococcus sp.]|nr:class B sortase [Ruminococcus sp.]
MTALRFWKGADRLYDRVLMAVLVVILLIVCYCMYDNYYVYSHTLNESLLKYKPNTPGYVAEDSPITEDMVAWLTVDGTNIDYPVMQGSDNIKYLNTDPYGNYSLSGSIFLDSRCSPDLSDSYLLVYGHHMEYGKMFGALDEFLDRDYLSSHRTGTLMVGRRGEKTYGLSLFGAMRVSEKEGAVFDIGSGDIISFLSDNEDLLLSEPEGRILALSTCSEGDSVSRIVVFCRILE